MPFVTALAKVRHLLGRQLLVAATVRFVAGGAIFLDRRMFPGEGATLVSVALVAELIEVVTTNVSRRHGAVRIMAVAT